VYGIGVSGTDGNNKHPFRYVRCLGCKHIYLNPRPTDDSLAKCYPSDYGPHLKSTNPTDPEPPEPEETKRSVLRRFSSRIPFLRRFLIWLGQQHGTLMPIPPAGSGDELSSHGRLLEIGCAHGSFLSEAQRAGWRVDGLEPNADAADRAKARGLDVAVSTLANAQFADESRDAIVAWMVLEHVPDPKLMVDESLRILTPGGQFCVSVPDAGGFERRMFGRYWLGYDAPRHLQVFTARRLRELLEEAGFVDVEIVHQASMRYWWGSIAAWGMDQFPGADWPKRWMAAFIGQPPRIVSYALMVPEKALSVLYCSGRITVSARKPS
jgi:SAM-dependent methyltransferase